MNRKKKRFHIWVYYITRCMWISICFLSILNIFFQFTLYIHFFLCRPSKKRAFFYFQNIKEKLYWIYPFLINHNGILSSYQERSHCSVASAKNISSILSLFSFFLSIFLSDSSKTFSQNKKTSSKHVFSIIFKK